MDPSTEKAGAASTPTNSTPMIGAPSSNGYGDKTIPTRSASSHDSLASKERDRDAELAGGVEGRDLKKIASVNNVASVPDGGLTAWLQVAGAFALFFNTWGIMNTFGVYQTYYELDILRNSSPSSISWIGSIQTFMLMFVGALTGPIYDAGYFRLLILAGSFLIVFGHMMLSLCTSYWQVLLAQAFCVGIGCGCLFVPSVAILSTYFTTRLATSMGVAASGSSMGGVIYPIVLHRLMPQIGFGWSVRVIGFISLATLAVPNLVMKVRVLPAQKRPYVDWTAFKHPAWMLFVGGSFIGFMGLYVPFFYVQFYAISDGITDQNLAFYLLSVLNAASVFGRIVPNLVADRLGPMNIMAPAAVVSGVLILCLIPVRSVGAIIVWCLLYGFFSGTFVSLPPTILVHLCPNRALIGTRMGMCFAILAIGALIGTPIAGAILDASGFANIWIFGGVLTVCGGFVMAVARGVHVGWALKTKA